MSLEQSAQATAVVIGFVNGIRLLQEGQNTKNYWGFILFCVALLVGLMLGFFRLYGVTLELGLLLGLGSSGLYRASELVGGRK